MNDDTIIRVEKLGKRYRIRHQAERQRYVALRDVIASKFKALFRNRKSEIGNRKSVERGLRGWAREVYSVFAGNLENYRAALRRRKSPGSVGESAPSRPKENQSRLTPASTEKRRRVCVLLSDGFGGTGGIAKFNRDLLTALCSGEQVGEVVALPRLMPNSPGPLPQKLNYDITGLGGKLRYTLAVLALARRKPSTISSQLPTGFDLIICAHINLLPVARLLRSLLRAPCSLHLIVHGVDAWHPTRNLLANACARRVDGFISVSNVTKRRFMRWSRLHDDQGVVLPNCVDLSAFTPGPQSDDLLDRYQLRGKKVILTFGRLASEERYKGFDEVLEIMPALLAEMPDLCYLICGDGQDRPRLAAKARALGLSVWEQGTQLRSPGSGLLAPSSAAQVVFAGYVPETEKANHYRLADAYVMPSSGEGFGIVYLEALACGVPVIGSRADGSREALLDGQLGILVDPRDRDEIIAAVRKVLKQKTENLKTETLKEDGSAKSLSACEPVSISAFSNGVDYFSTARFQQRVHDIMDSIIN